MNKEINHHSLALLGAPNSGKTTLFNALTGSKKRIGNWPGVTVEKTIGLCHFDQDNAVEMIDLPGINSLLITDLDDSVDLQITRRYLLDHAPMVLNVVDATALERDLYLTHELLELGLPVVLCLSKSELALKEGTKIDSQRLALQLGIPVIDLAAYNLPQLKKALFEHCCMKQSVDREKISNSLPSDLKKMTESMIPSLACDSLDPTGIALHCLEGDLALCQRYAVQGTETSYLNNETLDTVIADWRFRRVHDIADEVLDRIPVLHGSANFDRYVLNRFFGLPIFITMMFSLFSFAIGMGGLFQPLFDLFSQKVFIDWPLYYAQVWHAPTFMTVLLAGIGKGINTTFSFIPVLFFMFFALNFLEQSGYMVRAAVIVDRLMRYVGLSGRSFIPLIIGLGCNVPAVMATRTLPDRRDRILTGLMAPFMSCGARLAIYAVFVDFFFKQHAHWIVFSLYLIGILVAILTAYLVRRSFLLSAEKPLVIELPRYQWPSLAFLRKHTMHRMMSFIKRTSRIIITLCILLTLASHLDMHGRWLGSDLSDSILASLGQALLPLFRPMGISDENWPAIIALLSGMLAKEVVIGVLNTLYYMPIKATLAAPDLLALCADMFQLFSEQCFRVFAWISHPWETMLQAEVLAPQAGNALVNHFQSQAAAYAYLLFILLYVPCFSTVAAMHKELGRGWALFSVLWSIGIAYTISVIVYQSLTFNQHVLSSLSMMMGVLFAAIMLWSALKYTIEKYETRLLFN